MQENRHGISRLSASGHILFQVAEGSWNMLTALDYSSEIKQLVAEEMPAYWVLFIDLRKWQFCPPEVRDHFDTLYPWLAEHGMIAEGVLCDTQMLHHFVAKLNERSGHPCEQYFSDDYDDVYGWCQKQISDYKP